VGGDSGFYPAQSDAERAGELGIEGLHNNSVVDEKRKEVLLVRHSISPLIHIPFCQRNTKYLLRSSLTTMTNKTRSTSPPGANGPSLSSHATSLSSANPPRPLTPPVSPP
jgi:hypothetical protein